MLGRDHALLGAAAAVGLGGPVAHLWHRTLSPGQLAAAGVVTAGFALFPDIDEPGSTVSRRLGPASRAVSKITGKLAGGHRQATHSILFAVGVMAAVRALGGFTLTAVLIIYFALSLTLAMLVPAKSVKKGSAVALTVPVVVAWWVWRSETGSWLSFGHGLGHHRLWTWLPVAAGAGVALHLVGDMVTKEGVPLFWPIHTHLAVPLLGHTESLREVIVGSTLSVGLAVLTWFEILSPALSGRTF